MTDNAKSKPKRRTKSDVVIRLLRRTGGATIEEIMKATGWKPHSCRAFLSGIRKSDAGLLKEERTDGKSCYRITLNTKVVS